jgi:hypothetical protein
VLQKKYKVQFLFNQIFHSTEGEKKWQLHSAVTLQPREGAWLELEVSGVQTV